MDYMKLIHAVDPYEGFDSTKYPDDLQGWGGHQEFFGRLVEIVRPRLAIEVGSWKGRSAIAMAKALDRYATYDNRDAKLICVDTWLGATEFWVNHDDPKRYKSLGLVNGYPTVYYQFLANMVKFRGLHRVIPFPQSSINAARFLKKNDVKAQLIYLDGSHEYDDVAADIKAYWPILDEGGIIFGDDYCEYWDGVRRAVDEFCLNTGLLLQVFHYENEGQAPSDYWVATKEGIKL